MAESVEYMPSTGSSMSSSLNSVTDVVVSGERKYGSKCCPLSGNAVSLLTAFVLFTAITCAQYYAAKRANSTALAADCLSMAVDALAFLGNLFAECLPSSSQLGKRRIELTVRAGPTNAGSIKTHSFLIYLTSFFVVIFS